MGCIAIAVYLLWRRLEKWTQFEPHFPVVYIQSASSEVGEKSKDAEKCDVFGGCVVKEMQAGMSNFKAHLDERGLQPLPCPLFEKLEKEWVLYARPEDGKSKPKGRLNSFASHLVDKKIYGPVVVGPRDPSWRPSVLGRVDAFSGAARTRNKELKEVKQVTFDAVVAAHGEAIKEALPIQHEINEVLEEKKCEAIPEQDRNVDDASDAVADELLLGNCSKQDQNADDASEAVSDELLPGSGSKQETADSMDPALVAESKHDD